VDIQPAAVWGRLWQLPAGYPAIEVPASSILALGVMDPHRDARLQVCLSRLAHHWQRPESDWDLVHGEVITFLDPGRELPQIDRLEGFRPGEKSYYERVIVYALQNTCIIPVWLYRMQNRPTGTRISSGIWNQI
jgi:gamma-glutamylcyclotransferase (GGCT)/AIG2-like uncharacterized protein YtfP